MQGNSLLAAVEVAKQAGVLPIDAQGPQNTDKDNKKEITLSSLFSENKDAMDLFVAICFMVQRINTGGVNINELAVLDSMKNKLVDTHQLAPGTLEFIISAINNSVDMYRLFAKGSPEFQYIQKQLPISYCEIMAKNVPNNPGYLLKLKLTGEIDRDLKTVQSILSIFLTSHTTDILSISSEYFSFEPANPWRITYKSLKGEMTVEDNTVYIAFQHPQGQASSFFAVNSLVTIKRWLLRRLPVKEAVAKETGIKERPTAQDEFLDRQAFLGINPDFVSFSGNRPYSAKPPNSRVMEVSDVAVDDEVYEADDTPQDNEVLEAVEADTTASRVKGLFGRTKGLMRIFNKSAEQDVDEDRVSEVTELEDHYGYHISLPDYNGDISTYFDLVWSVVEEDAQKSVLQTIYKQIFMVCPQVGLLPIKVNVKQSIRGHWQDAAQGYVMIVDYKIAQPQE